jgi:FkbM family methyltransferase
MPQQLNVEEVKSRILQYASLKSELNEKASKKVFKCVHVACSEMHVGIKVAIQEISVHKDLFQPIENGRFVEFETYSLDEALRDHSDIGVIHIDAKGITPLVFYGMQALLTANPQLSIYIIFDPVSLKDAGVEPRDFAYQILQMGFTIAKVDKQLAMSVISENELCQGNPISLILKKIAGWEGSISQQSINLQKQDVPKRAILERKIVEAENNNDSLANLELIQSGYIDDVAFLQETANFTDENFVEAVYRNYLKREPDIQGYTHFVGQLHAHRSTHQQVLNVIRQSQEFKSLALKSESKNFDYSIYPNRLNLGCGWDTRDGYLNVDMYDYGGKTDLIADIRDLDMLPSSYYEEIIAQDCLEHMPRCDTEPALKEWSRLLKPGGIIRVRTTSIIDLLELFKSEQYQSASGQKQLVHCLFGSQACDGDWHFTGFTEVLLGHYLEQVGFSNMEFRVLEDWLLDVSAVKIISQHDPVRKIDYLRSKFSSWDIDWEKVLETGYRLLLSAKSTVIDIGGHAGRHSDIFINQIKCKSVYIFEPIPSKYQFLKNTYSANANVEIKQIAISSKKGKSEFILNHSAPEESGLRERIYNNPDLKNLEKLTVETNTLDNLFPNLKSLDYIKIDVEGGEIDILNGGLRLIKKHRPIISVEYGKPGYSVYGHSADTLFEFCHKHEYVISDLFGNPIKTIDIWRQCVDVFYWDYFLIPFEKLPVFCAALIGNVIEEIRH